MTIGTSNLPAKEYDFKFTDDSVVATRKIEYGDKTYTVRVYYECDCDPTKYSDELTATIKTVQAALGVFNSQLTDDTYLRLTNANKLLIGMTGDEEDNGDSYDFSFKGCLPAKQVEVFCGVLVEEVADESSMSESDVDDMIDPQYSEKDTLLAESYLIDAKKKSLKPEKPDALKPHVPIANSELSDESQKNLQDESNSFSHMISPCTSRNCGFSAFFCALTASFAQKKIDSEWVSVISKRVKLWAQTANICKSEVLLDALDNGLRVIQAVSKNPSQAHLRELLNNPYNLASLNFTLQQIALLTIYTEPESIEGVIQDPILDETALKKYQYQLFMDTLSPETNLELDVIALLQGVFRVNFDLISGDVNSDEFLLTKKEVTLPKESNSVKGVAIYKESGHYHILLNQRVFQFV